VIPTRQSLNAFSPLRKHAELYERQKEIRHAGELACELSQHLGRFRIRRFLALASLILFSVDGEVQLFASLTPSGDAAPMSYTFNTPGIAARVLAIKSRPCEAADYEKMSSGLLGFRLVAEVTASVDILAGDKAAGVCRAFVALKDSRTVQADDAVSGRWGGGLGSLHHVVFQDRADG